MKLDKQIFRKVLWAPTAVLSVSITLYLSSLWLSQKNMLNSTVPEVESPEVEDKSSPEQATPEGEEEKTQDESSDSESEQEGSEEVETKKSEQEAPAQLPSPPEVPAPPSAPTPPAPASSESSSSSSSDDSSTIVENHGTVDLNKYIAVKIKDINLNGLYWSAHQNDKLLESWKLTTTVESLLRAIQAFTQEQNKGAGQSN